MWGGGIGALECINVIPIFVLFLIASLTSSSFILLHFSHYLFLFRVMVHVVAQCHEEGLEHYLRSYVKVQSIFMLTICRQYICSCKNENDKWIWFPFSQFVLKPEPYSSTNVKTVHEELAKAMTAILKPSTDFLTSNKLLKVIYSQKWFCLRKTDGSKYKKKSRQVEIKGSKVFRAGPRSCIKGFFFNFMHLMLSVLLYIPRISVA